MSGGRYDPKILDVAARYNVPYICMHSRGTPDTMTKEEYSIYDDLLTTMYKEIDICIQNCRKAGIPE